MYEAVSSYHLLVCYFKIFVIALLYSWVFLAAGGNSTGCGTCTYIFLEEDGRKKLENHQ
jgi:hypothetical protein